MMRRSLGFCVVLGIVSGCLRPPSETNTGESVATSEGSASSNVPTQAYTWKSVQIHGGGFVTGLIFSPLKGGPLYARTDIGGAYRLDTKGESWLPITDHLGRDQSNYLGIESMAADPVDPNVVYAAVGTYTAEWAGPGAMMRSKDQGESWAITEMPIKMGGNENGRSNGERLAIDPNQTSTLLFGSRANGLWKSTDGSVTWNQVSFPVASDPNRVGIVFVVFDAQSGKKGQPTPVIYAGVAKTDKGLYRSTDAGKTWTPVEKQPTGVMPSHAEFDSKGTLYISYGNLPGPSDITTGSVWKLEPKTNTWTNITPVTPTDEDKFGYGGLSVYAAQPGTLVVTTIDRWTKGDEIFRTTDGGKQWSKVSSTARYDVSGAKYILYGKPEYKSPHWMGDIDIDPHNPNRAMFGTGVGIFATDNLADADTKKQIEWRFFNRGLEETAVTRLASPPSGPPLLTGVGDICGFRHDDPDQLPTTGAFSDPQCNGTTGLDFAQSKPELFVRVGKVWGKEPHGAFSTDGGAKWTAFRSEPQGSNEGGQVAVTADGGSFVWCVKNAPTAVSTDRGTTWKAAQGLPTPTKVADWAPPDLQPASDRVNPKLVYVLSASRGEIFVSRDGGLKFEQTVSSLPSLPEYKLVSASIQAAPGHEGHVWVTTAEDVQRSTDGGKMFETLDTVEESHALGFGKPAPGKTYPAIYLIGKVDGVNGFYRSDDEGKSWIRINDDRHQYGGGAVIKGDPRIYGRAYVGTHGRGAFYGMPR